MGRLRQCRFRSRAPPHQLRWVQPGTGARRLVLQFIPLRTTLCAQKGSSSETKGPLQLGFPWCSLGLLAPPDAHAFVPGSSEGARR